MVLLAQQDKDIHLRIIKINTLQLHIVVQMWNMDNCRYNLLTTIVIQLDVSCNINCYYPTFIIIIHC